MNRIKFISDGSKKPCSKKRILDFHSYHPINMKYNVAKQFLMNALNVTSPHHWDHTISLVSTTLSNSNYSTKFIKSLIISMKKEIGSITISSEIGETDPSIDVINLAEHYKPATATDRPMQDRNKRLKKHSSRFLKNKRFRCHSYNVENKLKRKPRVSIKTKYLQKPRMSNASKIKFIKCPFYPPLIEFLNKKIRSSKLNDIKLAPSAIQVNRTMTFSNTKSKKVLSDLIHSSFENDCKDCSFHIKMRTNYLDVQRTYSHFMNKQGSILNEHMSLFPDHSLGDAFNIRSFQNKKELLLTYPYECTRMS